MVRWQLRARGIRSEAVLRAMSEVPREAFVALDQEDRAYEDCALPIEAGQTISQPYVVALMCEALRLTPESKVLDVGSGSGYAAAVLSRLAREVHGVERIPELAQSARERLAGLGIRGVRIHVGDGSEGLEEHAPYDAIHVAAASPSIPPALFDQLAENGRLVIPVGEPDADQELLLVERMSGSQYKIERLGKVAFVPLVRASTA